MVIRLGRNGKFLACSTYPDHKETRPLPGEEAPTLEGDGDPCPQCGEGVAGDQARPVRRVRRLLALPGLHVHQEGRPAAARTSSRSRWPAPRTATATWSRVARGAPGTSSGGAPPTRSATSRRTTSRRAPSTTPTTDGAGAVARKGEAGLCLTCGAAVELPEGMPRRAAAGRWPGGPGRAASRPGPRVAGRRGARAGRRRRDERRAPRPARPDRGAERDEPRRRVSRMAPAVTGSEALDRFVRSLEARDTSPETRRSYEATVARVPRLARRARRRLAGTRARRPPRLPGRALRSGTPGPPSPSGSRPCARSTATPRVPGSPRETRGAPSPRRGCPAACRGCSRWSRWSCCVAAVEADLDAAGSGGLCRPARRDPELARALALRDLALVETAYAAGLRISELAAADLGSLDLRRGELRVLGKGRKERIGLLGRPAREALRRLPGRGTPGARCAGCAPLGRPRAHGRLPQPPRRAARRPGPAGPARPPAPRRRPARGREPAHAPPQLRDPPPRGRGRPPRRPGAAGPREPRHDAGLHARVAGPAAGRLPVGAPPGEGDLMDETSASLTGDPVRTRRPTAARRPRRRGARRLGDDPVASPAPG